MHLGRRDVFQTAWLESRVLMSVAKQPWDNRRLLGAALGRVMSLRFKLKHQNHTELRAGFNLHIVLAQPLDSQGSGFVLTPIAGD